MATLADKVAFAEKHILNKEGRPFSLEGRAWVRDQFWLPADGFKLWARADSKPCDACSDRIGDIIEHPDDNTTTGCQCGGLDTEPIIVTVVNVKRQEGKSFSAAAYVLTHLFKSRNKSFALMAASEDQVLMILDDIYKEAIYRNPALKEHAQIHRTSIDIPKLGNHLEALRASHRSVTARSRTHVLIDEARDVEARTAMAIVQSIVAMHGIECPRGHVQLTAEQADRQQVRECTMCHARLTPWYGRVLITSSSGIVEEGTEYNWLAELVEQLQSKPHPNYHLFSSVDTLNPAKSTKITRAFDDVLGVLPSTKHYIAAEVANQWTRKGEDFIASADLAAVTSRALVNMDGTDDPCVAFCDTSMINDKTSLVILADDRNRNEREGVEPWRNVYVARVDFWKPTRKEPIDERVIVQHMRDVLPLFPQLRAMHVDTRGKARWAIEMVIALRREKAPWANKVKGYDGKKAHESMSGWGILQQRILSRTITLPDIEEMRKEFMGAQIKTGQHGAYVADRNSRIMHRDITEALAMTCYLAHVQSIQDKAPSIATLYSRKGRSVREMLGQNRTTEGRMDRLAGRSY